MSRVIEANKNRIESVTEIALVDIVGFSKLPAEAQWLTAVLINAKLEEMTGLASSLSALNLEELILGFVPTGDGFFVILHPSNNGYGLLFGASLRTTLLLASSANGNLYSGVRVATHLGKVFSFVDVTGRKNFVGPGMNECARLLGVKTNQAPSGFLVDENFLFVSRPSVEAFEAHQKNNANYWCKLGYRKTEWLTVVDKHGQEHVGAFVEISRNAAWNPPKPADYKARMMARFSQYK